jgi:integrase
MARKRGNNEGSIFKRNNGSWRAQVTLDGKRLTFTANTKKECQQWISDTLTQIDRGLTYQGANIELADFLSRWLTTKKSTLAPKTYQHYQQVIQDHINPSMGNLKLKDIKPDRIQFLYDSKVQTGVGDWTIKKTHAILQNSLNHALRLGLVSYNANSLTTPPRPKSREMDIFDENQVQRMLIYAKGMGERNYPLYHMAVTTGMRQGELLGLKWESIDFKRRTLQVKRQLIRLKGGGIEFTLPKTNAGRRTISIGEDTIKTLKEHHEAQYQEKLLMGERWQHYELVFPSTIGTPMDVTGLLKKFRKTIKEAGLPRIRFHDLRHTSASLLLNQRIPVFIVSKRLGHAKPSTTLDIYGHLIPSMQEEAAKLIDELIKPVIIDEELKTVAPRLHH